jgi:hypothetical protein
MDGTADDETVAKYFTGFCHRHIIPAQMHPVGMDFLDHGHMVIDDEGGTILPAHCLNGACRFFQYGCRGLFHA